ncbi:MAG: hypothetical protein KDH20_09065 [Rhodocyclaceae bacterium]|nr:hypothetical protein [Rhodocyclaceae bacterium]
MIAAELAGDLARRFASGSDETAALSAFRQEHPELRFYACSEDDIPPRLSPWLSVDGVGVYLIDASEHCMSLTRDPEHACGLVFALEAEE